MCVVVVAVVVVQHGTTQLSCMWGGSSILGFCDSMSVLCSSCYEVGVLEKALIFVHSGGGLAWPL